jgi:hypothetical protein
MENNTLVRANICVKKEELPCSFDAILYNITSNQFILGESLDKAEVLSYENILNKFRVIFTAKLPIVWYAWKNGIPMKIVLKNCEELGGLVYIEPIEPFKTKHGFASERELIDMGFYIQCCIEITENFVIFELKTIEKVKGYDN